MVACCRRWTIAAFAAVVFAEEGDVREQQLAPKLGTIPDGRLAVSFIYRISGRREVEQ
jgi:hypothetical protein